MADFNVLVPCHGDAPNSPLFMALQVTIHCIMYHYSSEYIGVTEQIMHGDETGS